MPEPAYLGVAMLVSSIGFVMFMYGRKQRRPVQLGAGLLLLLSTFFIRDALWLGVLGAVTCLAVWGALKAGL
jgi:hypothetical protein